MRQLILGGARSGKSRLAERLALETGLPVTYVATAMPGDEEMQRRIDIHRRRRPQHWQLLETPFDLARTLFDHAAAERCLLVDCLTLWLSNHLCAGHDPEPLTEELAEVLARLPGEVVLVGNEVGMGIVPMGELSRRFADASGFLHQTLASRCERVIFTVAGLPQVLKGPPL